MQRRNLFTSMLRARSSSDVPYRVQLKFPRGQCWIGLFALSLLGSPLHAGEGMWLPEQLPSLGPSLRTAGIQVSPEHLADLEQGPAAAVVSLYGGTGSFISRQGLLITNHHVAYDAIQAASSETNDALLNGFLARTRADEVPAPGYTAFLTRSVRDVTADILQDLPALDAPSERFEAIRTRRKALVAECEKQPDFRCQVYSLDRGLRYQLVAGLELRDIRLVHAPPVGVGDFGGEIDNFAWPRHAGDFAFLRAYVGPDGRPAAYHPDNLPYRPPVVLELGTDAPAEGDPVMAFGFPYYTSRYETAAALRFQRDEDIPTNIRELSVTLSMLQQAASTDRARAIRLAVDIAEVGNSLTLYQRMRGPLERSGLVEAREMEDQQLNAWIQREPARAARWGELFLRIEQFQEAQARDLQRQRSLARVEGAGSLFPAAILLVQAAEQRARPDLERRPEFQERMLGRQRERLEQLDQTLDLPLEQARLELAVFAALELPDDQRIAELDALFPGKTAAQRQERARKALARAFARTELADKQARLALWDGGAPALERSRDPLILLARALKPALDASREQSEARAAQSIALHPALLEARIAYRREQNPETMHAPDANGSLRFSFGQISGMSPADAIAYRAFTTLRGVKEKHTGAPPFAAPAALLEALPGHEEQPMNFLATLDTTGGNSGSPVLDARGSLVGLLFDGNQESTADALVFWAERQRSLVLDLRYVRFYLEQVDRASALLAELGWKSPEGRGGD